MNIIKEQIAAIRKELKARPGLSRISVKNGTGTGYGWLGIRGSGDCHEFTTTELSALKKLGLTPGGNYQAIPPCLLKSFLDKLTA